MNGNQKVKTKYKIYYDTYYCKFILTKLEYSSKTEYKEEQIDYDTDLKKLLENLPGEIKNRFGIELFTLG